MIITQLPIAEARKNLRERAEQLREIANVLYTLANSKKPAANTDRRFHDEWLQSYYYLEAQSAHEAAQAAEGELAEFEASARA